MNRKGQFSLIAALLVAVILIATVIVTYSVIRSSPLSVMPQVLSAIDETNFALKQVLGFTIGYYGSVLQVTGNITYAKMLAENYLHSGLVNIANMHPDWGASFNVDAVNLQARWFERISYSMGDLKVSYNLTGLGIYGISYGVRCKLDVTMMGTLNGSTYMRIIKDENESLINLGKSNFKFYKYNYDTSTWEHVNPATEPTVLSDGTYIIDLPTEVDPDFCMVQVEDQRGIIVVASSFNKYTLVLNWNPTLFYTPVNAVNITLIDKESFEDTWPPEGWTATGNWNRENNQRYHGSWSADFDGSGSGSLTTFDINCYGATVIYVDFWYRDERCEPGDFLLQFSDDGGKTWTTAYDLGATTNENQWLHYRQVITDGRYFKRNFKIRWYANLGQNEHAYVDYVTVIATKREPSPTIVVELLQNGTIRWLGQNLQLTTQAKPIPPIPVKSIRVNQTINGVNQEVPFQIEDWASDYKVPLGLANNASIFSNRNMLVFLVNPSVEKVTIWWNGSDAAVQTPYAYTNRYFANTPPIFNNGYLTLRCRPSGFHIDATLGNRTTTDFLYINGEEDTTDPEWWWTLYGNAVVRAILQGEPEFSSGVDRNGTCYNFYAHVVITLPANTTYYTCQLRLIFLESRDKPRTINELRLIKVSTSASDTFSSLTENGTIGLYPRVSMASGNFFNISNVWQHHWSQLNSTTRGFGVMFPNDSNIKLYYFDSMASAKTGCIGVSTSSKSIEVSLVKLSPVVGFTSSLDICWFGAVTVFDTATPVYKIVNGVPRGLWALVEHPPTITVVAEG